MDMSHTPAWGADPLSQLLAREAADGEIEANYGLWLAGQARKRTWEPEKQSGDQLGASPAEREHRFN